MTQRDIEDAFVDTFFLEGVAPIRAQMPVNLGGAGTRLLAGLRVDNFTAVAAGGPYATREDMMAAFYANQVAFNDDPGRNRIKMAGSIQETVDDSGTVLIGLDIAYEDLPLSVFTTDSFEEALSVELDPAKVIRRLEGGFLSGRLQLEMVLPFPGAPLHFWNADAKEGVRRFDFIGHGSGWLLDEAGARIGRGAVDVQSQWWSPSDSSQDIDRVELTPIRDDVPD